MPEREPSQRSELRHSVIREGSRLVAFFPHDPDTNVRHLDHVDIVVAVPNRHRYVVLIIFADERNYVGFLRW